MNSVLSGAAYQIALVSSEQLAKQPTDEARSDFYDQHLETTDEESQRPDFPLGPFFSG